MAEWNRNKVSPSEINNGKEFTRDDDLTINELNAMVNNSFYGVDFAENMADQPDISEINSSGSPEVSIIDNVKNGITYKKFKFKNLKGERGADGIIGKDGKSAYQYAQEGGYSGTEQDFAKDLGEISSKVVVDSELSTTSTNPVQNKVVTTELNKKTEYVEDSIASGTPNPLANYYTKSETNDLIYNENLLVNGDFRINQRGLTKYKAYGNSVNVYTADMWRINYGTEVNINSNSITVKFIGQYSALLQYVQNFEDLKGKTLTLSVKVLNISHTSNVYLRAADAVNNPAIRISGSGITKVTFTMPTTATQLSTQIFNVNASGTEVVLDIEYMKLEIGDTATPNIPRPYAQELAMCQMPLPTDKWGLSTTYSNENILINGDFRVNQRGFTSTTTSGYTVDRWRITRANTAATLNDDGTMTLSSTSTSTQNTLLVQRLEEKDYKPLLGEPVALSLMLSTDDGASYAIHTAHTILPETLPTSATVFTEPSIYNSNNERVGSFRIYWSGNKFEIHIFSYINYSLRIKWVKFEKGYVATAFNSRPYAEELEMCKRFYQEFSYSSKAGDAYGMYQPSFLYPKPMRVRPTVIKLFPADLSGNIISETDKTVYDNTSKTELYIDRTLQYVQDDSAVINSAGFFTKDRVYGFYIKLEAEL